MFYEYIYSTILDSVLLMFMCLFAPLHIFYANIMYRPLKFKEGEVYIFEFDSKTKGNIVTESAFFVLLINIIALPIGALTSIHYWIYICISTILTALLFLSSIKFHSRNNKGNPGSIVYVAIPLYYFPATGVSILLHWIGVGAS